jgi:uncharacterized membrane protein YbaN (DUF454 family)
MRLESDQRRRGLPATRWLWFAGGWVAVALGVIGAVVPVMPSTVFFIIAAACFARSSPRFEAWLLALPAVGPLVQDHRAGLGMPRRAKQWAIAMIVIFCSLSAWSVRGRPAIGVAAAALGAVGVTYLLLRVPTRERVLADREDGPEDR